MNATITYQGRHITFTDSRRFEFQNNYFIKNLLERATIYDQYKIYWFGNSFTVKLGPNWTLAAGFIHNDKLGEIADYEM